MVPVALGLGFACGLIGVAVTATLVAGPEAPGQLPGWGAGALFAALLMALAAPAALATRAQTRAAARVVVPPSPAAIQRRLVAQSVRDAVSPLDLPDPRMSEAA